MLSRPLGPALESAQEPFCCVLSVGQGRSHSDQGEGISVSLSLKEENDTLLWGRVIGWRGIIASTVTGQHISSSSNCALCLWLHQDLTLTSEDHEERQTLKDRSIIYKVFVSEETQDQRIVFSSTCRMYTPFARLSDSETMSDAHVLGLLWLISCSRTFTPLEVAWTVSFSLLYPGPKFSEHSPSGSRIWNELRVFRRAFWPLLLWPELLAGWC